jgi:thiamine-phosphate pyrophosphorylase
MIHRFPRVYPITDVGLSGLSHAEQVKRLSAGGATLVQLREKNLSPAEFYLEARAAIEIARQNDLRIIINDRVDIAAALDADGVHLGQGDLPPQAARDLLGKAAIIGFSTHNVEQAREALHLPINYLAIGPVFETRTKKDTEPVVGLDAIRELRGIAGDLALVAIGGITAENAREVLDAGADSVAVISGLLAAPNAIPETTRDLIKRLSH